MAVRDMITAVAASPEMRQAAASWAVSLADGLWRWRQARKAPEDPVLTLYRQHLDKLDRLWASSTTPPQAAVLAASGDAPLAARGATASPSPAATSPPEGPREIGSACVPCTRAHLLGVRGDLREALRFARESGVDHPEARRRIDHAAEEVVMLERYDLTPEAIARAPEQEQAVIRDLLPDLRRLRQRLVNEVDDVASLEQAAIEASALYERLQERTRRKPTESPPAPRPAECSPCKLAAAIGSARAVLQQHGLPEGGLAGVEDRCHMDASCIRGALEDVRAQVRSHPEAHAAIGVILDETFGLQARPAA